MVLLFYTTYISVDIANHKIFCAKVGKGGINSLICFFFHNETISCDDGHWNDLNETLQMSTHNI